MQHFLEILNSNFEWSTNNKTEAGRVSAEHLFVNSNLIYTDLNSDLAIRQKQFT